MNDLIDTTEMYLRTIFELEEEGVVPLRARIAERLNQSGPTVSQTVARMERDGLLMVAGRSAPGAHRRGPRARGGRDAQAPARRAAAGRRHRPGLGGRARRGLPLGARDERGGRAKLVALLDNPTVSPYGNPIPGLDELGAPRAVRMSSRATPPPCRCPPRSRRACSASTSWPAGAEAQVEVRRIAEHVQVDAGLMVELKGAGVVPGQFVNVGVISRFGDPVPVTAADRGSTAVGAPVAHAVLVRAG